MVGCSPLSQLSLLVCQALRAGLLTSLPRSLDKVSEYDMLIAERQSAHCHFGSFLSA
jgi:hypothetical protein